jgi:hypothetical protein
MVLPAGVHEPGVAVSWEPTTALPLTVGADVLTGRQILVDPLEQRRAMRAAARRVCRWWRR